jgi:hypothetical protein
MNKSEIAEQIVEYVRRNHNSRSDELMELIAAYDVERAIAESQAPVCRNPNHALVDGSASPHDIGPSCMAECNRKTCKLSGDSIPSLVEGNNSGEDWRKIADRLNGEPGATTESTEFPEESLEARAGRWLRERGIHSAEVNLAAILSEFHLSELA